MTAGARLLPSDADNDLPFQLPPELPRSGPVDVPAMAAESHWPAEAFGALVLVSPALGKGLLWGACAWPVKLLKQNPFRCREPRL